jgi:outer membrane PBP1 activator LpoA protein
MVNALLLAITLAGCTSGMPPVRPTPEDRLQRQAQALETSGNFQGAAQLYLQAAATQTGSAQQELQLLAAESLIRGGYLDQARQLLDGIPRTQLGGEQLQHYQVNFAAIALAEQHPDQVLERLGSVPVSGPFVTDYRRLRAAAFLQNGQFFPSARERVLLDPLLIDPEEQLDNASAIWEALNSLTDAELQRLRTSPPPDPLSGWLELVELTRLYLQQPDALAEVTPHWAQRYPGHPASRAFIAKLLDTMRVAGQPPSRMALLLPLTGSLATAASVVRDGILSAYYDAPESDIQPQLTIYDSGDTPETALLAYQQAIADGAEFVIGPLRKEAVQALAEQPLLAVPTLALNQIETQGPYSPDLYQYGLAPEDEAREVARLAWRDGHTRSIALLPDTEWGERVFAAFAAEWESLGGTLLVETRYDAGKTDHGKEISAALNLDNSKARHLQLSRHLGQRLEFEPRRRQDVDFVFMVASPRQARLIRPQLSFYRASSLPVYATSRVYTGRPDKAKDADMNGIIFCDMPWTLESDGSWGHLQRAINEHWPANAARYARLYAFGIDAYRVVPYLGGLGGGMLGVYHGVTGNLSLDALGQINRNLRCAKFSHGLPTLLEPDTDTANRTLDTAIP